MDTIMDTPEFKLTQIELKLISKINEFKGKWQALSTLAPEQLSALRKVATVESVASSTRIEGVTLSDREVEDFLSNIQITRLRSRDEEEVAGYAECIAHIFDSSQDIAIDENHIKQLHQVLLKYSSKDARHRGEYKKLDNHVEAFDQDENSLGIIFKTSTPFDTPSKMSELTEWLSGELREKKTHSLLTIAVFIVHLLAIHPFQDGNGRLSRILTTLLLMQADYSYVPYSSLERIVEENKEQYYLKLRQSQKDLYGDNNSIMEWVTFFLHCLSQQVSVLEKKIDQENQLLNLPLLSQTLLKITQDRGKLTVREAVQLTDGNRNTIKRHLSQLVHRGALQQHGTGKGTWYGPA